MAGLYVRTGGPGDLGAQKAGAGRIDYKAVLTPTNQNWNALEIV